MRPLRLAEAWRAGRAVAEVDAGEREEPVAPPPTRPRQAAFEVPPEDDEGAFGLPPDEPGFNMESGGSPGPAELDDDEDVFDHGGDMGRAAYQEEEAATERPGCERPDEQQPPPAKVARTAAAPPPPLPPVTLPGPAAAGPARPAVVAEQASLAGLELRLARLGEVPRFAATR